METFEQISSSSSFSLKEQHKEKERHVREETGGILRCQVDFWVESKVTENLPSPSLDRMECSPLHMVLDIKILFIYL